MTGEGLSGWREAARLQSKLGQGGGQVVLGDVRFGANIPVRSVATARRFYEDLLGITPVRIQEREIIYRAGDTLFGIYETDAAGKAGHTLGTFSGVGDIEAVVAGLRARGVVFEEYDMPGIATVDGIADFGPEKVAWFRDPDGNLLSIDNARLAPTAAQG